MAVFPCLPVTCRGSTEAAIKSKVRVAVSAAEFEKLQTDQFGGWSSAQLQLLDKPVTVQAISCKYQVKTTSPACVIKVHFQDRSYWINPLAVTANGDRILEPTDTGREKTDWQRGNTAGS